jgi:hypothetical protein
MQVITPPSGITMKNTIKARRTPEKTLSRFFGGSSLRFISPSLYSSTLERAIQDPRAFRSLYFALLADALSRRVLFDAAEVGT